MSCSSCAKWSGRNITQASLALLFPTMATAVSASMQHEGAVGPIDLDGVGGELSLKKTDVPSPATVATSTPMSPSIGGWSTCSQPASVQCSEGPEAFSPNV